MLNRLVSPPWRDFLQEKPWGPFLIAVDSALLEPVTLHCIGGFVLGVMYNLPRPTADLDYIAAIPQKAAEALAEIAGQQSALAKKHRLFIHSAGVIDVPDSYADRLIDPGLNLDKLRLLIPEPYDLLLSKLVRNSPKDREDVKFLVKKLKLEFDILRQRFVEEMKPWLPNADRHELTLTLWKDYF